MNPNPNRAEALRLLGIADKLLQGKDFNGSREFAMLAQEMDPLLDGPDQILAVADVILAADKRITNTNHLDWYSILQLDRRTDDLDLIKKQYRRLAFLLHPDKNKFAFSDSAFRIVAEAWAMLSDSSKKTIYDSDLGSLFSKVDLVASMRNQRPRHQHQPPPPPPQNQQQHFQHHKLPVKRTPPPAAAAPERRREGSFWTACPYCYNLYEFPKGYEECCLRCQNCERAFHGAVIPALPPVVPGKEEYYCCWGFFPLGFVSKEDEEGGGGGGGKKGGVHNWIPNNNNGFEDPGPISTPVVSNPIPIRVSNPTPSGKKRGRPRKYPLPPA